MGDLEQHFLTDPEALAWILTELDPRTGERVVELGAGSGTIARALSQAVAPTDLTLVELDPLLATGLREAQRACWPRTGGGPGADFPRPTS